MSKRDSQKMYAAAKQVEAEHNSRLARIQSEMQALHVKQKQLAQVSLSLFLSFFLSFVRSFFVFFLFLSSFLSFSLPTRTVGLLGPVKRSPTRVNFVTLCSKLLNELSPLPSAGWEMSSTLRATG